MLAHSYCSWLAHMHICITRHGSPYFPSWPVVYIRAWSIYWPYRLQPTWLIHIDHHRPTRDLAFPVLASSYIHIAFHQLPFDRLGELCFICYNIGQYATNTLAHCVAYTFKQASGLAAISSWPMRVMGNGPTRNCRSHPPRPVRY